MLVPHLGEPEYLMAVSHYYLTTHTHTHFKSPASFVRVEWYIWTLIWDVIFYVEKTLAVSYAIAVWENG